jgi:dTDP-4-amino-4,6-dideoxygalactose transaminase
MNESILIPTNEPAVGGRALAINGGSPAITEPDPMVFKWPIVTREDEEAILEVLRAGTMSGTDVTKIFESEWSAYLGVQHSLGHTSGTSALLGALFGMGIGRGDEIIAPSLTYWSGVLQVFSLGATVVFSDIDPDTLCIDPDDIEHRITPRTKAIVVTHYCGHPCDMDRINTIARRHGLRVMEDCSHAHGGLYKGRMIGTLGDVSAFSMMTYKSFPIGEAGMLSTNDRGIYERALAFGHYERTWSGLTIPELKASAGVPLGGQKGRMNQWCSAMGRVQLRHFPERMKAIQAGMNRFWDLLDGVPGLRAHRTPPGSNSTMGGWYNPLGHYLPEELGGLPVVDFIAAVAAEGCNPARGANAPLHVHPVFNTVDVYGDGKPTRLAFADRDLRQPAGSLPVSERLAERVFGIPWFKHDWPAAIEHYAAAYRKVAEAYAKP